MKQKPSRRKPVTPRSRSLNLRQVPDRLPKAASSVRSGTSSRNPAKPRRFPWLRLPRRSDFKFTWKKFWIISGGTLAVLMLSTAGLFAYYVRDLPNPKQLSNRAIDQSTRILDRNGKLIYNFYGEENRTLLTSDKISDHSKKATIAVEDAGFYEHAGFSARGIARAVWCRIARNCVAGGGSTITQQYIKNALIRNNEQTLDRKLRELILSIEIEQLYEKEEILTGYLNEIPYGGSVYGIEAASQTFFNKSANQLTLSEAATLAAIPQRPTYFSPYGDHLDALFRRKNYVLDRMVKVGFISQEEADAAKVATPSPEDPTFTKRKDLTAPHFVFYVRQKLLELMDEDPSLAEAKLDQAGFVVTTSLDLEAQNLAESIMQDMGPSTVKKYGASNASLVAVDPKSGEIIAMVGSIDYEDSKSGNTNYANALLQPGSSFKPFVYATAFDQKYKKSPASITFDLETDFGNYVPQNYNGQFRGPVTNRNALAQSLNIPAVKNLYLVGLPDAIATAERLGISTLTKKPSEYGLSLVLGAGEVRPVEMASAYGTFATNGQHFPLRPILKVEKDGKIVKDYQNTEASQAIEPEVAYQITSILSDNNARSPVFGTRNNLVLPDRPVAAKTGTTNSNRDAWTVGYTPQIATAVWVGNNEANKFMNKGADGSIVAAPIWKRFMQEYLKGKPVEEFSRPDGLKEVTVDFLSGKLPTDQSPADQRVTDLFAEWQIPSEFDDVHVKVKIDKVTGKLATELTPAENIEERIYFSVRSEQPDKPNWEAPVQAWAQANGGGTAPPTEKDDLHTEANRPTISFSNPTQGSTVNGTFAIEVAVGGSYPISKVEFFINNISVGTRTSAPWRVEYNASSLPAGSQIIDATVTNELGLTRSDQVTVTRAESPTIQPITDSTPPGPVTGISTSKLPGNIVRLRWTNPADGDLASVAVYQSTTPGSTGARIRSVPATPGSSGSADFVGVPSGTIFTLRATDQAGNENQPGVVVNSP